MNRMLQSLSYACVESMTDVSGTMTREKYKDAVASLLALVLAIVIIAVVGKFLWNMTMPELFTFARPVQSCWQIIGLILLLSLLR